MPRGFFINGETMVAVKGRSDSAIGSLQLLGLSEREISVGLEFRHEEIKVDAWGDAPADLQFMLASATISMNLVNVDRVFLDTCIQLSMAGAPAIGSVPRAGTRMGGGLPRFAAGNNFIGLNLASPVGLKPWRFWYAYLAAPPLEIPLGTRKSIFNLQWRAIPYTDDPWGNPAGAQPNTAIGTGAQGAIIWDHVNDT